MNKRGISPLIATVLIIGFTVALAAIIITWGGRFVSDIQDDVDVSTQVGLACSKLDFEIVRVTCKDSVTGGLGPDGGDLDKITINSDIDIDIDGFTLRGTDLNGAVKVDVGGTALALDGFGTKEYTFTPTVLNATKLEAIAHITIEGTAQVCSTVIEKVERANICGFTP